MFKRKAYTSFKRWYEREDGTALLVTGARQVGKSFLVEYLGRTAFDHFVEVNLYENREARDALADATGPEDVIARLSLFEGDKLVPGRTLIFFDEIQELPDLLTMAKFLVQDGRFSYAFSGSMLGTELNRIRSYPVGSITEIRMYPMDFEEFCWANKVSEDALATVAECFDGLRPVPDYLHERLMAHFRAYMVVGGMPAAVQGFCDQRGDLQKVREVQADLVASYVHDITKYAGKAAPDVRAIFDQLPLQLDKRSTRFKLNSVAPQARYSRFSSDFNWLVSAGVALKCNVARDPRAPLMVTEDASCFKLYESDTGMLVSRYPLATSRALYLDDRSVNLGYLFENAFAQALAACGCTLFYYMNRKRGEVDFLIEDALGTVIPIEVKSGRSPRAHAALDALLATREFEGHCGFVFSRLNVEVDGRVVYLPWYALARLSSVLGLEDPYGRSDDSFSITLPSV